MFCNMCGQRLPDGSKFCVNCGAKVTVSTPKTAQTHRDSSYRYVPPKGSAREVIHEPGKRPDNLNEKRSTRQDARGFCVHCGAETKPDLRFCTQCGKAVGITPKATGNAAPEETKKKVQNTGAKPKRSVMRMIAWILLVLNVITAVGGFSNGSIAEMLSGGFAGIAELLGYFSLAIIAVVLFYIDGKRNKN